MESLSNRSPHWGDLLTQTTNINQPIHHPMKLTQVIAIVISSLALASGGIAADKRYKDGGCCDKAAKKGEKCAHPCCVAAEKDGKVCEKCNK